ncbi:MAG: hypothetical protein LQ348_005489 [Seirophora lacunosa]|nr:MAG: hypothetical protein LQ348_005489 [Seirophora lacunosa]
MPLDDLKAYATSTTDFYALLSLTPQSSQKELDRQWRKTALKYHPDKVGSTDTAAREKFHLAQIGYDLLSDPAAKAIYDGARSARERKKREREVFEGRRAQMRDDLEAREKGSGVGFKREREEDGGEEEKLERELRRLAEDGKRRRKEREDNLRKELYEAKAVDGQDGARTMSPSSNNISGGVAVSELDRTVNVRWPIERDGDSLTEINIQSLFSTFGTVENVMMLRPKELRLGGKRQKKKKQLAAVCMVQYASIVGAHSAVEDFPKQCGEEWERFDSVLWAANKEPEVISASSPAASSPSTPARGSNTPSSFLNGSSRPATPTPASSGNNMDGNGLKKMPSFSSFSSAAFNTPRASPMSKGIGIGSPSLEELTMIRLKNAEKKRLADELQRQDDEAGKETGQETR